MLDRYGTLFVSSEQQRIERNLAAAQFRDYNDEST
jgi:hypothetical protein